MLKFRYAVSLVACILASVAQCLDIDPSKLATPTNTDQSRLERACLLASGSQGATLRLDTRLWKYDKPLTIKVPVGLKIIGNSYHRGFVGPGITIVDPKPVIIRDLWLYGGGITIVAHSSANARFENCRAESSPVAFDVKADKGADASRLYYTYCEAYSCASGFRITGDNALDPHYSFCVASYCDTGFDLRQGGAGYVLDHCGGSYTDRVVWANGGYPGTIRDFTSELCKVPIEIGGEGGDGIDAGGWGQNNVVSIAMLDNRGVIEDLLRLGCDASVDFGKNKGNVKLRAESRTATLRYSGSPTIQAIGKWNLLPTVEISR